MYTYSNYIFPLIVPPPINLTHDDDAIHLIEPMYPHGNILQYEIVAVENSSGVMSNPLSISNGTLEFPVSMMITGVGTYVVKVCNIYIVMLHLHVQCYLFTGE